MNGKYISLVCRVMKYIWLVCIIAILFATLLLTKENITYIISFLTPYILFVLPICTIIYGVYVIYKHEIIISNRHLFTNPTKLKGRAAVWLGYLLIILGIYLAVSFYPVLFTTVIQQYSTAEVVTQMGIFSASSK